MYLNHSNMKTKTSFRYSGIALEIVEKSPIKQKPALKIVQRTDFKNHRFARIDNKSIQDAANWDASWFSNYE